VSVSPLWAIISATFWRLQFHLNASSRPVAQRLDRSFAVFGMNGNSLSNVANPAGEWVRTLLSSFCDMTAGLSDLGDKAITR
jgi:hypothetical protein